MVQNIFSATLSLLAYPLPVMWHNACIRFHIISLLD